MKQTKAQLSPVPAEISGRHNRPVGAGPLRGLADLIPDLDNIVIIGGGGKTGLMEVLEEEFRTAGRTVLTTVTTRLGREQLPHLDRVEAGTRAEAEDAARRAAAGERLLLAGPFTPDNLSQDKLAGLPLEWFPAVRQALPEEAVLLIEADGSAGRALKCHRDYEPVLPPRPYFMVAVLGLSALTRPWAETVHRPEILRRYISPPPEDQSLSPAQVADFVKAAWAGLQPDLIFLNQADVLTDATRPLGWELADRLAAGGFRTAIGSLHGRYLWET